MCQFFIVKSLYTIDLKGDIKQSILDNTTSDYIILFPNTLISGTTISTGITCERQAVLNNRFKTEGQNEVMFVGTLTHEVFQWAVANRSRYN